MSELRDRMIRDMTVRGLARRTHETYIAAVVRLAKHYRRSPDQLTNDEVQAYLAHLILERKLSWSTFIRRFLLHVVPGGFVRIRHFGFLANRTRAAKLTRCRALLGPSPSTPAAPIDSVAALMRRLTGLDIARCPLCPQGRLHITEILAPTPAPRPRLSRLDTS